MNPSITLIAAIGRNREIGALGKMLWHIPQDLALFRALTLAKPIIMGHGTFVSLGKRPLPRRKNIVLSRQASKESDSKEVAPKEAEGVTFVSSVEEALQEASRACAHMPQEEKEIMVIGGAQIYAQYIEKADRLYLTHVDADYPDADRYFPMWDPKNWKEGTPPPEAKEAIEGLTKGLAKGLAKKFAKAPKPSCRFQSLVREQSP